jgi:NADPH-dependent 2,4-dienoyl-CoA reductase/sulfur reductase-like enzyme
MHQKTIGGRRASRSSSTRGWRRAEIADDRCDPGLLPDDPHTHEAIRVEHWVVAERQGAVAGANMLGAAIPFEMVPFFWTKHFDLAIRYVGHAQDWDEERCEGSVPERDVIIRYLKAGRELAVATVGRDLQSIQAEQEMMRRLTERRRASASPF